MYVSHLPPTTRTYTRVAPMFNRVADNLQEEPSLWLQMALPSVPGRTNRAKQIRIHAAMAERGLKVSTACDETSMYIRLRVNEA